MPGTNIFKYVVRLDNSASAPMETMTNNRVYVTLSPEGNPKGCRCQAPILEKDVDLNLSRSPVKSIKTAVEQNKTMIKETRAIEFLFCISPKASAKITIGC